MRSLLVVLIALLVSAVLSSPCVLQSPVSFVIPTFQELYPDGNSNALNGQAIWVYERIGSSYTRNNITFNVCTLLPEKNTLVQYITHLQLTISTNQTLGYQYGSTVAIENQVYYNTSLVNNCTSGSLSIPHDIPLATIDDETKLSILDDRGSVYVEYYINGIEEMDTDTLSSPPEVPTLLDASSA